MGEQRFLAFEFGRERDSEHGVTTGESPLDIGREAWERVVDKLRLYGMLFFFVGHRTIEFKADDSSLLMQTGGTRRLFSNFSTAVSCSSLTPKVFFQRFRFDFIQLGGRRRQGGVGSFVANMEEDRSHFHTRP